MKNILNNIKEISIKKYLYILCIPVIVITNTIPVQAVSDFYSENDIQFYDPNACNPNESSTPIDNSPRAPGGIYIVGDSITVLAKDSYVKKFSDNGWSPVIEGLSSRHISSNSPSPGGINQVKNDKDKIKAAKTVVVALGTNDQGLDEETLESQVKNMVSEVKKANSDASIFWVNIIDTRNYSRSKNINNIIADSINDTNIIDWYSKAKSKANLSSFDTGVHPTQQGDIDLLVNTVYDAVSNTDSEPAPDAESSVSGESDASNDTLEDHRLPAVKGGTGQEDPVGSNGLLTEGDVGAKITFPKHVSHGQEYQDYYLTMRLPYVKWSWSGKASEVKNDELKWYKDKPRKVVVTNPRTNKSIITVLAETGPAPWTGVKGSKNSNGYSSPQRYTPENYTGRVSGLPPKAMKAIGAKMIVSGKGDTLYYAWAPDQNAKPGPTSLKATGQGAVGGEDDKPTETQVSCCPSPSATTTSSVSGRDNEQKVWNYFKRKGLDDNAVAGIMGNIANESGFEPTKSQVSPDRKDPSSLGGTNNESVGAGKAWGLIQWDAGGRAIYYAKKAGITSPIHEIDTQLDIIWWHLNNETPTSARNVLQKYKDLSTSPKEAASAWEHLMEGAGIPRMERRWNSARILHDKYKGTGNTSTNTDNSSSGMVSCSCNDPNAVQAVAASGLDGTLKDAARAAGSHEEGATAVSVSTMDGGVSSDVGGEDQKQTRSVYKMYVAYGVIYSIEKGVLSWNDHVSGSYMDGTSSGIVSKVMEDMIVDSNNGAAKALATKNSYTGGSGLTNLLQNKVGLSSKTVMGNYSSSAGTNSKSTTNDMVKFLQLLYKKKLPGITHDEYYNKLIGYMKRAKTSDGSRSGIVAGVGGAEVASKSGWNGSTTNNDAGIVYLDGKPYAIAIISGGGWQNVANIAKAANSTISGSSSTSGSCDGAVSGDLSSTVKAYAWPDYHPAPYPKQKPAYKKAVEEADNKKLYRGGTAYPGNDCGGFITLAMRNSGYEKGYNHNGKGSYTGLSPSESKTQWKWLQDNWDKINPRTTGDLQSGDVAINSSHTFMYVGKIDGFNSEYASASWNTGGGPGRAPMAGNESIAISGFTWYRKK